MSRAKLLWTLACIALLGLALAGLVMAEGSAPAALTGKVTSQAEGAMEGVIVGAKKVGSTITTWVVSNAQGQYSFPRERRSEEHTSELQSLAYLVCRLLLEKKKEMHQASCGYANRAQAAC